MLSIHPVNIPTHTLFSSTSILGLSLYLAATSLPKQSQSFPRIIELTLKILLPKAKKSPTPLFYLTKLTTRNSLAASALRRLRIIHTIRIPMLRRDSYRDPNNDGKNDETNTAKDDDLLLVAPFGDIVAKLGFA